jgi:hypothetical protein
MGSVGRMFRGPGGLFMPGGARERPLALGVKAVKLSFQTLYDPVAFLRLVNFSIPEQFAQSVCLIGRVEFYQDYRALAHGLQERLKRIVAFWNPALIMVAAE